MISDDQWKIDFTDDRLGWIRYLKECYPHFDNCSNKNVLEIAPFRGTHTQVIESHGAKNITLVELNQEGLQGLRLYYPEHDIVENDIFDYLQIKRDFDVVVCCGLLYHLPSPLHLLELISNMVDPEFLYIETYTSPVLSFEEEPDNDLGMRQLKPNYKSTKLALKITEDVLLLAIKNLGYELAKEIRLDKPNAPVKMWIFKKV